MEKLREAVLKAALAKLKQPLSSSQIALIDRSLRETFPHGYPMPTHPTYASMVLKAITELNEEDGSLEDSISEYIKANFYGLPWAHKSFLSHHLNNLCDEGVIVLIANDRYTIPGFTPKCVLKNGKSKRKQVGGKGKVSFQDSLGGHGKEEDRLNCERNLGSKKCKMLCQKNELENQSSISTKLSSSEIVKYRGKYFRRKNALLLTGGTEEEPLVDGNHDKTRNESSALQDNSIGGKGINNGASVTVVKRNKESDNPVDRVTVCGIATKLRRSSDSKRRVTRQMIKSKEQPTKLVISPISPSPSSKLQKHDNQQENSIPSSQETKGNWPSWIQSLLRADFYGNCKIHANVGKSVCNFYCLDCKNGALCTSCVTTHEGHHIIKIKQADYDAAVDISDIGKYIDISEIRTLQVNSRETTVILKRSFPSWHYVVGNTYCLFCQCRVASPFKFCTLSCKFDHEQK